MCWSASGDIGMGMLLKAAYIICGELPSLGTDAVACRSSLQGRGGGRLLHARVDVCLSDVWLSGTFAAAEKACTCSVCHHLRQECSAILQRLNSNAGAARYIMRFPSLLAPDCWLPGQ